jgi:hypothetical protein
MGILKMLQQPNTFQIIWVPRKVYYGWKAVNYTCYAAFGVYTLYFTSLILALIIWTTDQPRFGYSTIDIDRYYQLSDIFCPIGLGALLLNALIEYSIAIWYGWRGEYRFEIDKESS